MAKVQTPTAIIYQFPTSAERGRLPGAIKAGAARPAHRVERVPSGAWYHEAAIRASEPGRDRT